MPQGYLALVLHAHLPFVRHPEVEDSLEERWLFEALTESYIPLLQVFQGFMEDKIDFSLTMSLSPTLITMLTDSLLQERYLHYLTKLIRIAASEIERTADEWVSNSSQLHLLAKEYHRRFTQIQEFYLKCNKNLINVFRGLADTGHLELITTAATHAFLPLVATREAIHAQIATAVEVHVEHFGARPKGIWLPECGYTPWLDGILRQNGIEFFFIESQGLTTAKPSPVFGTLSPVVTPNGVAAFARDEQSSRQVWSAKEGFPGHASYREYYRDIGFDLDLETVQPYIHSSGIRVNTGIKYYRVTGETPEKELYDVSRANAQAALHAETFVSQRKQQVLAGYQQIGRRPIIVSPYDAELFGHWWYEGPLFLDALFRKIHHSAGEIQTITPSAYLSLYTDYQVCTLPMSSWGRGGYAQVWLCNENDWVYPALHKAEHELATLSRCYDSSDDLTKRALNQAARELMLAQSSDWAFIMENKTVVDYAVRRTKYHVQRFSQICQMIRSKNIDPQFIQQLEFLDNIFPNINAARFQLPSRQERVAVAEGLRILMLSWEYPPQTVGGLSRHVYDLSRFLTQQGVEVHVITQETPNQSGSSFEEGVHVHRVRIVKPDGGEFQHWAFQLNLMMLDQCRVLMENLHFDVIHAHDWLVSYAARALKEQMRLPLVATIHATEHGRNQGIHTELQRSIHHLEGQLIEEARRVIVCSTFMKREVMDVFLTPAAKVHVLPNGVEREMLRPTPKTPSNKDRYALEHEKIVLFVGRLVREKGVHVLIEAVPLILQEVPEAKFVIVGAGPMEHELKQQVLRLQVRDKIHFTGFVDDEERNQLLHLAHLAVFPSLYEPFGIVALEAMAAGIPVIVSDVGGLDDLVEHRHNGLKMYAGDSKSLAAQVKEILHNAVFAKSLANTASHELLRYDWNFIAQETLRCYQTTLHQDESLPQIVNTSQIQQLTV